MEENHPSNKGETGRNMGEREAYIPGYTPWWVYAGIHPPWYTPTLHTLGIPASPPAPLPHWRPLQCCTSPSERALGSRGRISLGGRL